MKRSLDPFLWNELSGTCVEYIHKIFASYDNLRSVINAQSFILDLNNLCRNIQYIIYLKRYCQVYFLNLAFASLSLSLRWCGPGHHYILISINCQLPVQ